MITSPQDILTAAMLIIGTFFMFVGAVGVVRMPDLFMRMSATTKAATLGVAFTLGAVAIHFNELGLGSRAVATIVFVFITAPVAAHMIGRAGYARQVELWKGTTEDELRGRYDPVTGELVSKPPVHREPPPGAD